MRYSLFFLASTDIASSARGSLVPRTIETSVGADMWIRQGVPVVQLLEAASAEMGGMMGLGNG